VAKAWAAREAGSKAASASVDTVVQQLQSRLENVASQRAKEAKAAQAELRVLREARASASMDLAQTHGVRCAALRCVALRCIALHCVALRCVVRCEL